MQHAFSPLGEIIARGASGTEVAITGTHPGPPPLIRVEVYRQCPFTFGGGVGPRCDVVLRVRGYQSGRLYVDERILIEHSLIDPKPRYANANLRFTSGLPSEPVVLEVYEAFSRNEPAGNLLARSLPLSLSQVFSEPARYVEQPAYERHPGLLPAVGNAIGEAWGGFGQSTTALVAGLGTFVVLFAVLQNRGGSTYRRRR